MREPQLSISPPEEDEAFRERIIAGESVIDYMDIYSQPGTRILFHNKGGHPMERDHALKILNIGSVYTVSRVGIGQSYSFVELVEFPGHVFNTVQFGTVKVLPPKESKQLTQYMPSRDDSKSPGQKFMRQSHSRSAL